MRSREPNNDPDNRLGEKPMESLEIEHIHQSSRRANAYDSDSYHHDAYTDSEEESPIAPYEYRHRKSEHNDTTSMLDPDDARPLVGSSMIGINNTRLTALQTVVKSRACWPVYIGIALVVSLLIAAIAYVPPARRKVTRPDFICPNEPASSLFWTHFTHKVQTWVGPERCRTGQNNEVCSCEDPTQPSIPQSPDSWREGWQRATLRNAALIQDRKHLALDVVLLGDSITEHWLGTGFAEPNNDYQANVPVYQSLFSKEHGAVIEGLALGIIGDRCPNLLARLQNNETVQGLSVKVLWVLIGTNDYASSFCRVDCIVAGNLAIVRELRLQKPEATIVINGLLPRSKSRTDVAFADDFAEINRRLSCIADTLDDVVFFDAAYLFLTEDGGLNRTMLPDGLHPGEVGSRVWGQAIVDRVLKIDGGL